MKYQRLQTSDDKKKWLKLETTLGTNEAIINKDIQAFVKLVYGLDPLEKKDFEDLTGIKSDEILSFEIKDLVGLQLVLLRKFISKIGLPIINEAMGVGDQAETQIFLTLARQLLEKDEYPEAIFVYSVYRRRGTPNTWLNISEEYSEEEIKKTVDMHIKKIFNSVNYRMDLTRRYLGRYRVGESIIYMISKPTVAKVVRGEKKNVEVQGASHTFVVLDLQAKRIGVVSGSLREIQIVQRYLTHKTFDQALAPPRNDVKADGVKLLRKIIKPDQEDIMLLQGLELRKTALKNNPSLKVRVQGNDTLDEALDTLQEYWSASSISDLKHIEFAHPTGIAGVNKKVGLYTYGDEWRRTYFNTSTRNVTSLIENQFLTKISKRLGNEVKSTRFILEELNKRFIVDKFLRDKTISTNPAIPEEAERTVVELTNRKLISKQDKSVKRKCWNCYATSWDQWACPTCGFEDMRIVSEALRIKPNEGQIMQQLAAEKSLTASYQVKYYPRKQRRKHIKNVVGLFDPDKKITTFAILVATRKDVEYAQDLSEEGFGVVAIIDPKIEARQQEIENAGATTILLTDIVLLLLGESTPLDLASAISDQEKSMLSRIYDNAQMSLRRLSVKRGYDENLFEVDVKNLVNILVPDVVRLGTEYSGTSVPDGYLRYGTKGVRTSARGKRLFGWDAKYSQSSAYRLVKKDVKKQKSYISWLMDRGSEPRKFGRLGIYAIISNFDDPKGMNSALDAISKYTKLKKGTRIVLIEDMFLAKLAEWLLDNWQQALENTSVISDETFAWLRRKQKSNYTISKAKDWPKLEKRLSKLIPSK